MKTNDHIDDYLAGHKLYGDDFTLAEIEKWFKEEEEGYANLGAEDETSYNYQYHAQNRYLGYRYVKKNNLKVLSIGGAYGDELLPIVSKISEIHILEPSSVLRRPFLDGIKLRYKKPSSDGSMDYPDDSFDLLTCFGVLHHIPNISKVLSECFRVLNTGGIMLLREPIVSMGDWREKRGNLTKNERGIPADIFTEIIKSARFTIEQEHLCYAKPFDRIFYALFKVPPYNSKTYVRLDKFLAATLSFNYSYHAVNTISKIRPAAKYYVLTKK